MKKTFESNPEKDETRAEAWKRIVDAQIAWLPFRDASCLAEVENLGGTLERVEVPGCKARSTKDRIQYLKRLAESHGF